MNTTTSTGFVYHADYLKHDTGVHPETAERLRAIIRKLEETGITEKLRRIVPTKASKEQLRYVHAPEYIKEVEAMCRRGGGGT